MTDFRGSYSGLLVVGTFDIIERVVDMSSKLVADNAREQLQTKPVRLLLTGEHSPTRRWFRVPDSADQQPAKTLVTVGAAVFALSGRRGFDRVIVAPDGVSRSAHTPCHATGRRVERVSTGAWLTDRVAVGGSR